MNKNYAIQLIETEIEGLRVWLSIATDDVKIKNLTNHIQQLEDALVILVCSTEKQEV